MASTGIEVKGLREVVRSLERFGVEVSDLKAAFKRIGTIVAEDAQTLAPKKSGALAGSIRPSNTKNKSVVRAGSGKVVYAGVQEYGGYNNIEANSFLRGALEQNQATVVKALSEELDNLIRRLDLN